jgi:hypothetical protein
MGLLKERKSEKKTPPVLQIFLGTEERRRVTQEVLHWLEPNAPNGTNDVWAYTQTAMPEVETAWDPNEAEGWDNLHSYREALMAGLREGGEKGHEHEPSLRAQHSSMRDYVKHTVCILPSILRALKISKWSMPSLWGKPRGTLKESYKKWIYRHECIPAPESGN